MGGPRNLTATCSVSLSDVRVVPAVEVCSAVPGLPLRRLDALSRRDVAVAVGFGGIAPLVNMSERLAKREIASAALRYGSAVQAAMRDYATDRRGDVGSWVREVAMEASAL